MIPFENERSLTKSEEYCGSILDRRWDYVVRATSGVLDDIGGRYPRVAEEVSQNIRKDVGTDLGVLFRPGVPDFIAFNQDGSYLFVEVKSSDDGLRHTQLKWLRDFQGINCEIWFSEHEKDYEELDTEEFQSFSFQDKRGASDYKVRIRDNNLVVELPKELAAITGIDGEDKVSWRLKSKDELILDTR